MPSMEPSHVDGHRPFGPLLLIEGDTVTFVQALESCSFDTFVMYEQISSSVRFDETITLVFIEPFYSPFHNHVPFIYKPASARITSYPAYHPVEEPSRKALPKSALHIT
jgi:hypothetical protein